MSKASATDQPVIPPTDEGEPSSDQPKAAGTDLPPVAHRQAFYGSLFRLGTGWVVLALAVIGVIVTEALRYAEMRVSRWREVN